MKHVCVHEDTHAARTSFRRPTHTTPILSPVNSVAWVARSPEQYSEIVRCALCVVADTLSQELFAVMFLCHLNNQSATSRQLEGNVYCDCSVRVSVAVPNQDRSCTA